MYNLSATTQPGMHIAIVRFSALGDIVLAVAAVRQLQRSFPHATITWITSPLGYALLEGLEGVQFEVFEKPKSFAGYRNFYRAFRGRKFDVVLAMQANLRTNLLYPALHAPVKIGFDRIRAREGQWLFCNRHIPFEPGHLADSFMAFAAQLGATLPPIQLSSASVRKGNREKQFYNPVQPVTWDLPITDADKNWARAQVQHLPRPLIAIHPCASKTERNWLLERYAETITAAKHKWPCSFVFSGGNQPLERDFCARLAQVAGSNGLNLCGQTTPKQLAALLGEADVLIAPDTAAVHLARAMNTPVIGLYAVASPALSGPYQQMDFVVNRYPDAVRKFSGRDPDHVAWNTRVHHPEAMSLITTDDVLRQLAQFFSQGSHV